MVHLIRRRSDKSYFALKRVPIDKDATDEKRAINNEVSRFCLAMSLSLF